jgi:hypothetical protein
VALRGTLTRARSAASEPQNGANRWWYPDERDYNVVLPDALAFFHRALAALESFLR